MKRTGKATWIPEKKHWRIDVRNGGTRRSFYSSTPGRAGQREAHAKADAWLEDGIISPRLKVSASWSAYLADVEARSSLSNYKRIKSIGDAYILPVLGLRCVGDITEGDLQTLLNRAYKHGAFNSAGRRKLQPGETLSRKSLSNILAVLRNWLKYCRTTERSTTLNPEALKIPAGARYVGKAILQPDSLRTLFSVDTTVRRGKRVPDPYINAYRLAACTGLRPGELIGLRWGNLSADHSTLTVTRSVNVYGEITAGKNSNAQRRLDLPQQARIILSDQLQAVHPNDDPSITEPIFDISCEETFRKCWQRYCESNGIPRLTLYELRHTYVSLIQTLPEATIKRLVGHSKNMDTFGVYAHELTDTGSRVSSDLTNIFTTLIG